MKNEQLERLRLPLLHLHKTLLEYERNAFEKVYGKVSPNQLLNLLIQHQQFAWLHTISELIVHIDELMDQKEAPAEDEIQSIVGEAQKLLNPLEISKDFAHKYQDALQQDPAVVMAHKEVRDALK